MGETQGPWLCRQYYLGPCPVESFMYTMSAALLIYVFHEVLDHGCGSGTFCENVVSVKMVIQPFPIPTWSVLLRTDQSSVSGAAQVSAGRLGPAERCSSLPP